MLSKTNNTNKLIFLKNIQIYLFILIPPFLITGPFLSDLSLSIIAILEIYFVLKFRRYEIFNNFYIKLFIIFWLYILFNSLIINFNIDSLRISFFYFRYLFFVIAVMNLLNENNKILVKLFYSIFFCFALLIFDGFFQYFFGYNILGFKLPPGPRASSFFGDELILGSYLSRLMPIFFGLSIFLFKKEKNKLFILSIIFVLVETLVFISGERTAFFYINLSAVFIIFLIRDYKVYRSIILLLSALLILLITFFNPNIKHRMIDTTLNQIGFHSSDKFIFSNEHQDQYLTSINMFKKNPFFGVGIKQFRNNCDNELYKAGQFSCSTHSHNIYLQFLSELGLIGFIFIFYLFIIFLRHTFYHFFQFTTQKISIFNNLEVCLLSSILITLWPFGPSGNFFNNWLSVIFYIPVPIFFWSIQKNKKNLKNN